MDLQKHNDYCLYNASRCGNVKEVKELLAVGANPYADDGRALEGAIEYGRIEVVKVLLIAEGGGEQLEVLPTASPVFRSVYNFTLQKAVRYGQVEIVKVLLKAGTFPCTNIWGDIIYAAFYGRLEIMKMLIAISTKNCAKCTVALRESACDERLEIVKELIAAGADVNAVLEVAVRHRRSLETVKVLLDAGANIHRIDNTILEIAVNTGCAKKVKLLLDAGANFRTGNKRILYQAVHVGRIEIVKLLLAAGIDTNNSEYYESPLELALNKRHPKFVKLLIDAGANIHKCYLLLYAVDTGCLEIVELFLNAGANVFASNHCAFRKAIENGYKKIATAIAFNYTKEELQSLQETLQSPLLAGIIARHRPRVSCIRVALHNN